ncbi:uncharacterized protein G2W53_012594 [Senna tora]|uniref:Uncharacterized protein n=1 Tax=Senna tora TaxID=362788 RepID=A0A834U153_9FABA|nr:uncharacterized protein G2W53_012594 [Senna tora]
MDDIGFKGRRVSGEWSKRGTSSPKAEKTWLKSQEYNFTAKKHRAEATRRANTETRRT